MVTGNFGTKYPGFNRRKKREHVIFISLIALAFLLLSVFILSIYSRSATATKQAEVVKEEVVAPVAGTVVLYTPARDVAVGTKISEVELKEIFWPRSSVPEGSVQDLSVLKEMYVKEEIPYGEPIQLRHLSNDRTAVRSIDIASGMRAVTIEVNARRSVDGWALPGRRVDVILTYMDQGELTSKVVVENARILTAGGDISTTEERLPAGRKRMKANPTVTLEVPPEAALKIETAQQLGNLSLHMRAQEDNRASGVDEVNKNDISGKPKKEDLGCTKGKMRIAGKDYFVDCDGKLIEN